MLRNGVIPMPPAMNTTGMGSGPSVRSPTGPKMLTGVPNGASARLRLSALPVIRVAITRRPASWGGEAIEKVRLLPFSSVYSGSGSVIVRYWPAIKSKPAGRSNAKARVPSATSVRSMSREVYLGFSGR